MAVRGAMGVLVNGQVLCIDGGRGSVSVLSG